MQICSVVKVPNTLAYSNERLRTGQLFHAAHPTLGNPPNLMADLPGPKSTIRTLGYPPIGSLICADLGGSGDHRQVTLGLYSVCNHCATCGAKVIAGEECALPDLEKFFRLFHRLIIEIALIALAIIGAWKIVKLEIASPQATVNPAELNKGTARSQCEQRSHVCACCPTRRMRRHSGRR